jgi:hypothetical protein
MLEGLFVKRSKKTFLIWAMGVGGDTAHDPA